ncbi:hypothetical protein FIBSPDRAFT_931037 [Athelia psychrophila]|uniref:MYND-type domain-containing protein n=1 Tax=Athelia psychrophila TaxID=1759441 RepID=A0A166L6Y3_9AGAM|nr:hypothetical protein FIBSPDRAFT_931037 [Fibularhizoctonia sp. CBS 109695]
MQADNFIHETMQLEQLFDRVSSPITPPISKLQAALHRYLSASALPGRKAIPSGTDERAVRLAILALSIITGCQDHFRRNDKLDPCFLNAWPGIWTWLHFLYEQCCRRARYGDNTKIQALVTIATSLGSMSLSKSLQRKVQSTPGVVTMLTRLWRDEGRYSKLIERAHASNLDCVSHPFTGSLKDLLTADDLPPNCIPDVVAASGGAKAAATSAIQHLQAVLAEKPARFLIIYNHISLISQLSARTAPEILYAMLPQGMTVLLVKTFLWLEKKSPGAPEDKDTIYKCMSACIRTLITAMQATSGPSLIVQALDAGLLPAVLTSASKKDHSPERIFLDCSSILFNVLSMHLVYRDVIRSTARSLTRVEQLKIEDNLGGSIKAAWTEFKTLAHKRIYMKELFDEGDDEPQIRCDQGNCHALIDHEDLLRCSGCSTAFYCGRDCQRMHWPSHKTMCQQTLRILRGSGGMDTSMNSKCTRFIHYMVMDDFNRGRGSFDYSPAQHSPSKFVINMDYTQVPLEITIVPIGELRNIDQPMETAIETALKSNGTGRGGDLLFTLYGGIRRAFTEKERREKGESTVSK